MQQVDEHCRNIGDGVGGKQRTAESLRLSWVEHTRKRQPELAATRRTRAPMCADDGRGLHIVAAYSTAWGYVINPGTTGKLVWATLRVQPIGRRDSTVDGDVTA